VILADTNVWIDHLKCVTPELVQLLEKDEVLITELGIGWTAC